MKKILGLTVAALLVMGLVGGGTWAYFSDVETSSGNILTAGTLDLKTDDADGVTGTLLATTMKPGDSVPSSGDATVTLKNSGSMDATTLDITVAYVEADGATEPTDPDLLVDLTAAQFAAGLEVNTLSYGATDLLALVGDDNSNGIIDMEDVQGTDLTDQAGIDASDTADFKVKVTLDATIADNDFQNDGIDITFTFTLNQ